MIVSSISLQTFLSTLRRLGAKGPAKGNLLGQRLHLHGHLQVAAKRYLGSVGCSTPPGCSSFLFLLTMLHGSFVLKEQPGGEVYRVYRDGVLLEYLSSEGSLTQFTKV